MTEEKSALERAVAFASFDGNGSVAVSEAADKDRKRAVYESLLQAVPSAEQLFELLERLEQDLPYFRLCPDAAIATYFARWQVPITTREDVELFSYTLAEKVAALAATDAQLQPLVMHREYLAHLRGLPSTLASLERTVADFSTLTDPFAAVIRYVWEAVTRHDFKMLEEGRKATESYNAKVSIQPSDNNSVHLQIVIRENADGKRDYNTDVLEFYIHPVYKWKDVVRERKRWLLSPKKRIESVKTDEIDRLELLPLYIFDRDYPPNINKDTCVRCKDKYGDYLSADRGKHYMKTSHFDDKVRRCSPGDFIHESIPKTTLTEPDRYAESLKTYLAILFNLPVLMENYARRVNTTLRDILALQQQQ